MSAPGILFLLSAPSGTGKGTVVGELLKKRSDIEISVSWITRPPRTGEVEGVSYFFKSEDEFDELIRQNGFLEHAGLYGKRYGTPLKFVNERLQSGRHVLLEIDTQGAMQVIKKRPDAVSVFLLPPTMRELKARLTKRGTETLDKIEQRFTFAYSEITMARHYDYCIINDDAEAAAERLNAVIEASACRSPGCASHIKRLQEELI